jgi:hypothetical protein
MRERPVFENFEEAVLVDEEVWAEQPLHVWQTGCEVS